MATVSVGSLLLFMSLCMTLLHIVRRCCAGRSNVFKFDYEERLRCCISYTIFYNNRPNKKNYCFSKQLFLADRRPTNGRAYATVVLRLSVDICYVLWLNGAS